MYVFSKLLLNNGIAYVGSVYKGLLRFNCLKKYKKYRIVQQKVSTLLF